MIGAEIKNGHFSLKFKLIGKDKVEEDVDFFVDTGFNGYFKINKDLFDRLVLEKMGTENVSFANGRSEIVDVSRVKFKVDNAEGECPVFAVGWGGRNLVGTKFLEDVKMMLVIDGLKGIYMTTDRNVVCEVGKTLFLQHNKNIPVQLK